VRKAPPFCTFWQCNCTNCHVSKPVVNICNFWWDSLRRRLLSYVVWWFSKYGTFYSDCNGLPPLTHRTVFICQSFAVTCHSRGKQVPVLFHDDRRVTYTSAIRKETTNVGAGRARACEVASHDSLPCKLSHDWSPSVCSCLCRVSYDVSCYW
jgi:hypothetical protein